jgi:hypothetical protein
MPSNIYFVFSFRSLCYEKKVLCVGVFSMLLKQVEFLYRFFHLFFQRKTKKRNVQMLMLDLKCDISSFFYIFHLYSGLLLNPKKRRNKKRKTKEENEKKEKKKKKKKLRRRAKKAIHKFFEML